VDVIREVQRALLDLDLGRVRSPSEAIRRLEKTSPLAAELVNKAWSRDSKLALLSMIVSNLVAILAVLAGFMDGEPSKPTPEEIAVIVKEVMDQAEERSTQTPK
jgi:hypothetical protein